MTPAALKCTHCATPMRAVMLEGHYGQQVEVDLCAHCHLLWLDDLESVRLSGLGWIGLLRQMHTAATDVSTGSHGTGHGAGTQALKLPLPCPRCAAPCKPVRNLTLFGRTAAHECPQRHGQYQTFALLLAERGLVRPLSRKDRQTLHTEHRPLTCLNCGAPIGPGAGEACSHCASPLVALDLPRLLASVMVRHALPLPAGDAKLASWACHGCGDAVDPTQASACGRCGHAVVAPSLQDALPLLAALEPKLRAMRAPGARPMGERLHRAQDYRATAFYRHVVRPLLPDWDHLAQWLAQNAAPLLLLGLLLWGWLG